METTNKTNRRAGFAERAPGESDWAGYGRAAEGERAVMVAEFHAWVVKTRINTEQRLLNIRRHMNEIEPFARAGMDNAQTPADVPHVVLEFASSALDVAAKERELALLNVYYGKAAQEHNDVCLTIEPGGEAEVNTLWEMFIEAREAK